MEHQRRRNCLKLDEIQRLKDRVKKQAIQFLNVDTDVSIR